MNTNQVATWIALLRGINIGGKNKLPMRELAALFAAAGCEFVQTYIQSGNVVYEAGPDLGPLVPALSKWLPSAVTFLAFATPSGC